MTTPPTPTPQPADRHGERALAAINCALPLPEEVASRLERAVEAALRRAADEARAEERDKCCKDVCYWCRKGMPGSRAFEGGGLIHNFNGKFYPCHADAIRRRAGKGESR